MPQEFRPPTHPLQVRAAAEARRGNPNVDYVVAAQSTKPVLKSHPRLPLTHKPVAPPPPIIPPPASNIWPTTLPPASAGSAR